MLLKQVTLHVHLEFKLGAEIDSGMADMVNIPHQV